MNTLARFDRNEIGHLVYDMHADVIDHMMNTIYKHRWSHKTRKAYMDGIATFRDLGVAIPPSARNLNVALGFPSKAIDSVAQRIVQEGYSSPRGNLSDYGIDEIIYENRLLLENAKVHPSALVQASVFQGVFKGDTSIGEPDVVIQSFEATHATGVWNPVTKRLHAALTILNEDDFGVNKFAAYFNDVTFLFYKEQSKWRVEAYGNSLGEVPIVPITYGATLSRPFGKSYLTREMMNITDNAMRTVARNEIAAELFAAPQRYITGLKPSDFSGDIADQWKLTMGRLLIAPPDKNGQKPEVGTFEAHSTDSGVGLFKMYAAQFAAAAKLPLQSLGIEHSNPASAEGVNAVREDLIRAVECANESFAAGHAKVMELALKMKNGLRETPEDLKHITPIFRNPASPSISLAADWTMKAIAAGVIPADSDVALRRLGLNEAEVQSIKNHRSKSTSVDKLKALLSVAGVDPDKIIEGE